MVELEGAVATVTMNTVAVIKLPDRRRSGVEVLVKACRRGPELENDVNNVERNAFPYGQTFVAAESNRAAASSRPARNVAEAFVSFGVFFSARARMASGDASILRPYARRRLTDRRDIALCVF